MQSSDDESAHIKYFQDALRQMEIESYSKIISVFRAKGNLTEDRRKLLKQISSFLNIPGERHRAEARKVSTNSTLSAIAEGLTGNDGTLDWFEEGKRGVPVPDRVPVNTVFTPLADYVAGIAALGTDYVQKANKVLVKADEVPSESHPVKEENNVSKTVSELVKLSNMRDVSVQTVKRKYPLTKGCTYCKRRKELKKKKPPITVIKKEEVEEEELSKTDSSSENTSIKKEKEEDDPSLNLSLPSGRSIVVENTVPEESVELVPSLSATIIAQEVEVETEPLADLKSSNDELSKYEEAASTSHCSRSEELHFFNSSPDLYVKNTCNSKRSQVEKETPSSGKGTITEARQKRQKVSAEPNLDESIWSGAWAARTPQNPSKSDQRKPPSKPKNRGPHRGDIILQSDIESELGYTKKKPEPDIKESYRKYKPAEVGNPYKKEYRTPLKSVQRKTLKYEPVLENVPCGDDEYERFLDMSLQKPVQKNRSITKSSEDRTLLRLSDSQDLLSVKDDKQTMSIKPDLNDLRKNSTHFSNRKQSFKRINHHFETEPNYATDTHLREVHYGVSELQIASDFSESFFSPFYKQRLHQSGNVKPSWTENISHKSSHSSDVLSSSYSEKDSGSALVNTRVPIPSHSDVMKHEVNVPDSTCNIISHSSVIQADEMSSNQNNNSYLQKTGSLIKLSSPIDPPKSNLSKINEIVKINPSTGIVKGSPQVSWKPETTAEKEESSTSISTVSQVISKKERIPTIESSESFVIPLVNGHEDLMVLDSEGNKEFLRTGAEHFVIPVRSEEGTLAEVSPEGEIQFDPNDGRFDSEFHALSVQLQGKSDQKKETVFINGVENEVLE